MKKEKLERFDTEKEIKKRLDELALLYFCRNYYKDFKERIKTASEPKLKDVETLEKEIKRLMPDFCQKNEIEFDNVEIEFSGTSMYIWQSKGLSKTFNRIDSELLHSDNKYISMWRTGEALTIKEFICAIKSLEV